jgi:hypothetical protein
LVARAAAVVVVVVAVADDRRAPVAGLRVLEVPAGALLRRLASGPQRQAGVGLEDLQPAAAAQAAARATAPPRASAEKHATGHEAA